MDPSCCSAFVTKGVQLIRGHLCGLRGRGGGRYCAASVPKQPAEDPTTRGGGPGRTQRLHDLAQDPGLLVGIGLCKQICNRLAKRRRCPGAQRCRDSLPEILRGGLTRDGVEMPDSICRRCGAGAEYCFRISIRLILDPRNSRHAYEMSARHALTK